MTSEIFPAAYNTLPTLGDADKAFDIRIRAKVFAKLEATLQGQKKWAVSLMHHHTDLDEGEIMYSVGNVTEPRKKQSLAGDYHPERWLSNGTAYEFCNGRTEPPPTELFEGFTRTIKKYNLENTLGPPMSLPTSEP